MSGKAEKVLKQQSQQIVCTPLPDANNTLNKEIPRNKRTHNVDVFKRKHTYPDRHKESIQIKPFCIQDRVVYLVCLLSFTDNPFIERQDWLAVAVLCCAVLCRVYVCTCSTDLQTLHESTYFHHQIQ